MTQQITRSGLDEAVKQSPNKWVYLFSEGNARMRDLLGGKGAGWVTLTPDGTTAYVANPVTNDVSVVDVRTMKEVMRIPVGFEPKRNVTGVLQ